jgi:TetR/AcrR family transcriptional repressor of nem operon
MPRARTRRTSARTSRKQETHQRILASAARLVRKRGLTAASVSRVMHGAGLTIGGFYAHFPSKRAMDIEVLEAALGASPRFSDALADRDGLDWLQEVVHRYLSQKHRDDLDGSCAFPAVVSEVARADEATRAAFDVMFAARVRRMTGHAPARAGVTPRERALATFALCIGGLTLARALRGQDTSDEVLAACRKWALPEQISRKSQVVSRKSVR